MITHEEFKALREEICKKVDEEKYQREELEDKEKLEQLYVRRKKPMEWLCRRYYVDREMIIEALKKFEIPLRRGHTFRRSENTGGYVTILFGDGTNKAEHRHVWEQVNGSIPGGWIVHHINGIRNDNRLENLIALSREKHSTTCLMEVRTNRILALEAQVKSQQETIEIYEEVIYSKEEV